MEIRTASEDVDFEDHPLDMMDFQKRTLAIPDDFCHKNRQTTEQKFFVGMTLHQRLEECGEPAIGLEFITEYLNIIM